MNAFDEFRTADQSKKSVCKRCGAALKGHRGQVRIGLLETTGGTSRNPTSVATSSWTLCDDCAVSVWKALSECAAEALTP